MRILILPSWYPTEDQPISGIFFKEQAQALIKAGHEVYVFYQQMHSLRTIGKNKNNGLKYRVEDNVPTYRFEGYTYIPRSHKAYEYIQKIRLCKFAKMLEKKHGKIDLVHAHSFVWGGITAAALCKHSGIPLIITEHSTEFSRGLIKSHMKPLITKASQVAHKVIVVGPGLKEELCNYMDEDKLVIIPNIVNINNFDVVPQQTNSSKFTFFSLCFLTHKKGIDVLLRAFAQLKINNCRLIIGGDGEERKELEKLADLLFISDRVVFKGMMDRKSAIKQMQECDAFVLPSRHETFGVVFVEALACGKPIIATKSGGPDQIVNNNNGVLVEVDNVNMLAIEMDKMIQNIENYDPKIIREDCINRFSEEAVIKQINKVYENAIKNT